MPTREAEILYPRALAILEDLAKLEEELAMAGNSVAGELIIGASTIPGAYILPSLASSFKNRYPGISFEIRIDDSTKVVEAVINNELFLGVVGAKIPARKIAYTPFLEDELILVCSGESALPQKTSIEELRKLPFIFRENGSGTRKNIETFFEQHNVDIDQLNVVATLGSSTAVKEAVKADLGITILSRHALVDELQMGSIKEIALPGLPMKRMLYIASAKKRTLPNHYQVFLSSMTHPSKS